MNKETSLNYWKWFFRSNGKKPGYRRVVDKWLCLHITIGIILSYSVNITLSTAANAVLLPLAGILIGLSFAWAGNAQALMQSEEIENLSEHHEGGFVEYVFVYQTAILTILVTLVFWGLAGLQIFDKSWPTTKHFYLYFLIKAFLFMLSSLTLHECWSVVMGAQWMLISKRHIKKHSKGNSQ